MFEQAQYPLGHLEVRRKRNSFSGLFKAQILSELINRRRSLKELAEQYEVHPNQIKNWKSALLKEASHVLEDKRRTKVNGNKLRRN